jgi:hypothetical protein
VLMFPDVHRSEFSSLHRAHLVLSLLADRAEGGGVGCDLAADQTFVYFCILYIVFPILCY